MLSTYASILARSPPDFTYLSLLSFLMSLVKGLSILFIYSKNQVLVLLIFCITLLDYISFISTLIFILFFFSTHLGFFVLFLIPLGIRLDNLISIVLDCPLAFCFFHLDV